MIIRYSIFKVTVGSVRIFNCSYPSSVQKTKHCTLLILSYHRQLLGTSSDTEKVSKISSKTEVFQVHEFLALWPQHIPRNFDFHHTHFHIHIHSQIHIHNLNHVDTGSKNRILNEFLKEFWNSKGDSSPKSCFQGFSWAGTLWTLCSHLFQNW